MKVLMVISTGKTFHFLNFFGKLLQFSYFFRDDGDSLDTYKEEKFTHLKFGCAKSTCFSLLIKNSSTLPLPTLSDISIAGLQDHPTEVKINSQTVFDFEYEPQTRVLSLSNLNLSITKPLYLKWE